MERRLSAILAADVVGYSRLVERDEANTFERLRAHRKDLFEPKIAAHHGRIFKLTGDGLLAEFGSVVDAVECAVLLQREMAERNSDLPVERRIDLRMGINLGDVIIEDEDRHGEGVVIAARLQQLAEAGGIAVSGTVVDHVKHKLALRFDRHGQERLKNITEPVTVYRIRLQEVQKVKAAREGTRRLWATAAVLLLLVAASLVAAWFRNMPDGASPSRMDEGIPVIVVLPFRDLSGDQARSDLGQGIAEAFTTDLATFPDFEVVSSTSAFAYANMPVPEIVKTTGAVFVIEGSVRVTGDNVGITVQLIRGDTDRHLRIAQIEERMSDPVALQTTVAGRLRDQLGGMTGLLRKEIEKIAWDHKGSDITEYDYYVRGHALSMNEPADWLHASEQWSEGLKRYPDSVLLRCKLSFQHFTSGSATKEVAALFDEATGLKRKSQLDEWYYQWVAAWLDSKRGNHRKAVNEAKAVIAMAPYDTLSHNNLAWVLFRAQLYDQALDWFKFAAADPNPKRIYFDDLVTGYAATHAWSDAIEFANAQIAGNPPSIKLWYDFLGTAYARSGQPDKARDAWDRLAELPDPPGQ